MDFIKSLFIDTTYNKDELNNLISESHKSYDYNDRGLKLEKYGNVYKLVTKSIYNDFLRN